VITKIPFIHSPVVGSTLRQRIVGECHIDITTCLGSLECERVTRHIKHSGSTSRIQSDSSLSTLSLLNHKGDTAFASRTRMTGVRLASSSIASKYPSYCSSPVLNWQYTKHTIDGSLSTLVRKHTHPGWDSCDSSREVHIRLLHQYEQVARVAQATSELDGRSSATATIFLKEAKHKCLAFTFAPQMAFKTIIPAVHRIRASGCCVDSLVESKHLWQA